MKQSLFLRYRLVPYVFISLIFLLAASSARGQNRQVQGVVTEAGTGEALPGVRVSLKNRSQVTYTNVDGSFTVTVPNLPAVLVFSSIGFSTREISVTGPTLKVQLRASDNALNEVVVVAYGSSSRANITGSVASVSAARLENRQVSNVSKALQGLVPGLQSTSSSGQPGTEASIRIRGIGSINASSAPLYVVDGTPFNGDVSSINPNDVESISVLKDAASSALYGSRGANGVIIITTKQGRKTGETSINASITRGYSSRAVDDYQQVSTDQYFELYWEAVRNAQLNNGLSAQAAAEAASRRVLSDLNINPYGAQYPSPVGLDGKIVAGAKPLWNDSWADVMQRTGKRTQADLSFSGGSDKSTYYISGGYLDDQGTAIGSGFRRYNARVNLTSQARKWLTAGLNISAGNTRQDYPQSEDSQTSNVIIYSRLIPNIYPVYERNPDGSLKYDQNGNRVFDFGAYRPSAAIPRSNLAATVDLDKSEILRDNVAARSFLEATIVPGLKFKTSYNADFVNRNDHFYTNPQLGESAEIRGSVDRTSTRTFSFTVNNLLSFEKRFNDHHLNLLGGQEFYKYNQRTISGSRQSFVLPGLYEPDAASQLNSFSGSSVDYRLLSFLGRAEYDYQNKYLFSASLRTDGSSRFSPDSRWGTFWSVGASWKLSEEQFLKGIDWLNLLTLRASYGAQGNDNIGTYYAYEALYAISNNLGESGVVTSRLPTPDLKWESNLNFNLGLDVSLLAGRISATAEYFNRESKDLLFARPLAPSTGFSSLDANVGAVQNTGFEVQLNLVPVKTRNFRWDLNLNATHYKNKITELPQKEIISGTKKLIVGGSLNRFFLKEWAGVSTETGLPQWYKTNSDGQKVITNVYAEGSQYLQNSTSLPDVYGGITNTFRLSNFELSALLSYSVGGKILDNDYTMILHNGSNPGRSWSTEILNRWTPENRNTDVPALSTVNNSWNSASTRFLYSATYARLKTLSLSYNLPKALTSKLSVANVRFSLLGENLLTFYGHQGMDPEQTVEGTTYYRYPAIRSLSAGLQLTF